MGIANLRSHTHVVSVFALLILVGCGGGGDININAPVTNNSTTVEGGAVATSNPCAYYVDPDSNVTKRGAVDGDNCKYGNDFASETNPIMVDVTIPKIDGVHIFDGTLQIGRDIDSGSVPPGPTLTIMPGNTLVWNRSQDYLIIHRGAKINAEGTSDEPITFTAYVDAVEGAADPFAVQLWGGVVINGKGITNKCDDDQRTTNTCHIQAEGKPTHYGGNDNADDSGILKYVIIKHPGFEVAPGDELNGLTLNTVGSATVIENIQVYSTYDDGVEFFGGAVRVRNLIAQYVRDDSIDYADGWQGSVTNALVIHHQNDGNRCIEADNQGSDFSARPLTSARISNMTCITSGQDESAGGTHGDSEGVLLRRGVASQIENSVIFDGYARNVASNSGNECLELDDSETRDLAQDGTTYIKNTIIACQEATKDSLNNGDSVSDWVTDSNKYPGNTGNMIISESDSGSLSILGGSLGFFTQENMTDSNGASVDIVSDDGTPIGAVTESNDWTEGWAICLQPRSEAACGLWFVN